MVSAQLMHEYLCIYQTPVHNMLHLAIDNYHCLAK
jgi:hypothetical protein